MALLFEYGEWVSINNRYALKQLLTEIWQQRLFVDIEEELTEEKCDHHFQPFLKFDDDRIKANNFIGFIQTDNDIIEIYPKVFRNSPDAKNRKGLMLQHIFYWLNYCRKWRFPFHQVELDTRDIKEFPEIIINLIANQFLDIVSKQPLTLYQQVEEALQIPKGSINFKRYINNGLSHGNYHFIECDYEPFSIDNKVNRIIKYCARLLLNQTKYSENHRILQEVIFVMDEVDDVPCNIHDVERTAINPFFEDYLLLIDSCKLILNQQLYSNQLYDLTQWCLLLPMEYVFEDFFAGFLEDNFRNDWKVEYQKSEKYLATNEQGKNVFKLQHDIFLTSRGNPDLKIIVDTKYKIRDVNFKNDFKKGIAQADLYQMVSYAFRRGCTDILLVYPNLSENLNAPDKFKITSSLPGNEIINVTAIEIPFWSLTNFENLDVNMQKVVQEHLNNIKENSQVTNLINCI